VAPTLREANERFLQSEAVFSGCFPLSVDTRRYGYGTKLQEKAENIKGVNYRQKPKWLNGKQYVLGCWVECNLGMQLISISSLSDR